MKPAPAQLGADRCKICGAPRVDSGDGHDDEAEPLCLRHLKAFDPDAADLPEAVLNSR